MKSNLSEIIETPSIISHPYTTIRITQSRLDKGLIAIPISLATKWFPNVNTTIKVYLGKSDIIQLKGYSSFQSTTHEARIGGLAQWFQETELKGGDEIVIQLVDKEHLIYRLIPERHFISTTKELQHSFDNAETEQEASGKITSLAQWTHLNIGKVVLNEYYRLINAWPSIEREYIKKSSGRTRESVPSGLRTLLGDIYKGHCQVCDFWFLKKDKEPYFETHHLDPSKGHHPQNLLVVCGNCHNQFEHADVKQEFNNDLWLVGVYFNESMHSVNQAVLTTGIEPFFKELFI